ncbi:MAG: TRAP transporter small permease [Burkholderiaceae bacterium]
MADAEAGGRAGGAGRRLHVLCRAAAVLGVGTLFLCALVTVIDVLFRRSVGWTVPGMVDLTQLLVMIGVFLCIPLTFEQRANVEVDLLFERLPAGAQRWASTLWSLLGAVFLALIVWYGAGAALQVHGYGDRSPTLNAPMLWYWLPLLIGIALSLLICLHQLLGATRASTPSDRAASPPPT